MHDAGADLVTFFARSNFRRLMRPIGIRQADRLSHLYIVGKTGVGKSTLIETMALGDLRAGRGFALIDPHGDLSKQLLAAAGPNQGRLIHFDAADDAQPYGYNPLRRVRTDMIPLAASGLLESFRKLWPDAWGMRMEHVFRNCLYALLETDGATLSDVIRLLSDKDYRKQLARLVTNPAVCEFFETEYENYPARLRAEAIAPIQNKLGALLVDPRMRRILTEPSHDLHFREIMDGGHALVVDLARGRIGEDAASTLGSLIVTTLGLAAFTRADVAEAERRPFFIYIDEFQNFTTLSFVNMMSELRKYGVGLCLAHQHLHQLEPDVRHAVLGNAGSLIAFRLGAEDALFLEKHFRPQFEAGDLSALANRDIFLRLMLDGAPSPPFSARTLDRDDQLIAPRPRVSAPQVTPRRDAPGREGTVAIAG